MRKRYSRSYTVLSFLTMFSYREQPSTSFFLFIYFITAPVFAEETSFAYLESQPVVTFGAGAT